MSRIAFLSHALASLDEKGQAKPGQSAVVVSAESFEGRFMDGLSESDTACDIRPELLQPRDYERLADILIEAIPTDRKRTWAGKIMSYLASQAKTSAADGKAPPRVQTKTIHSDLGGNPNLEPSAWLSSIWKDIEARHYPEIQVRLIELCRQAGLTVYPVLEKDNGKPAYYRLGTKLLPPAECPVIDEFEEMALGAIRYQHDLSLELSWLGKLFFTRGLRWTVAKRYGYLSWQLLWMIAILVFDSLLWLILWHRTAPASGQDLMIAALAVCVPWGAYRHFSGIFRLLDDRMMIAPEWMLAWKEFGATIEISRSRVVDAPSTIHIRRYSADCPICGWMVKLDRGEPDYPRRIVGRCEEHPREHVFSFDRSSRLGAFLQRSKL